MKENGFIFDEKGNNLNSKLRIIKVDLSVLSFL